jgi:hypothetical protein
VDNYYQQAVTAVGHLMCLACQHERLRWDNEQA